MDKKDKKKTKRCPICKKPVSWKDNPYRPFCSEKCKMADLYSWLNEEYKIVEKIEEGGDIH